MFDEEVIGYSGVPVVCARAANAIFCDDVRLEESGKLLVIGMYADEMGVPSFPLQLPVFTMLISASTPADRPFERLAVKVYMGREEIASLDAPSEAVSQLVSAGTARSGNRPTAPAPPGGYVTNRWRVSLRIAPFIVAEPGVLRVRVVTEAEEIPAGGLKILQVPA